MSTTRVPQTIPEFNTYINNTDAYLQATDPVTGDLNWKRLGLTNTNASDWSDKRKYWHDTLYPKYSDPLQSTGAVKDAVHNFMSSFRAFSQPLLNIMAASPNATSNDEHVFNFKIGRANPTHATTPIADTVLFDAKTLGGGQLHFTCRTAADSHRASIAAGADSVQLAYEVTDSGNNNPNPNPGTIPTPEDKGMVRETFTHAQFTFHAGAVNVGKRLVVFARWFNTKHPELAGPWSAITVVVIA